MKLVELEKRPADSTLLNDVFRGFHTIKGGAGFVNLPMLVDLCHLTENVFDLLRKHELTLNAIIMDAILAATAAVRGIFDEVAAGRPPAPAEAALLARLRAVAEEPAAMAGTPEPGAVPAPEPEPERDPAKAPAPDWDAFYELITSTPVTAPVRDSAQASGRRAGDDPVEEALAGRRTTDQVSVSRDTTIRIDTGRLDQVLTLSGELGLSKNRLMCLRQALLAACSRPRPPPQLRRSHEPPRPRGRGPPARGHEDAHAAGRAPVSEVPAHCARSRRGLGKEVELSSKVRRRSSTVRSSTTCRIPWCIWCAMRSITGSKRQPSARPEANTGSHAAPGRPPGRRPCRHRNPRRRAWHGPRRCAAKRSRKV